METCRSWRWAMKGLLAEGEKWVHRAWTLWPMLLCGLLIGGKEDRAGRGVHALDGHDADACQQTHEDPQLPELQLGEERESGDV